MIETNIFVSTLINIFASINNISTIQLPYECHIQTTKHYISKIQLLSMLQITHKSYSNNHTYNTILCNTKHQQLSNYYASQYWQFNSQRTATILTFQIAYNIASKIQLSQWQYHNNNFIHYVQHPTTFHIGMQQPLYEQRQFRTCRISAPLSNYCASCTAYNTANAPDRTTLASLSNDTFIQLYQRTKTKKRKKWKYDCIISLNNITNIISTTCFLIHCIC